jgi:hypothetical protein
MNPVRDSLGLASPQLPLSLPATVRLTTRRTAIRSVPADE